MRDYWKYVSAGTMFVAFALIFVLVFQGENSQGQPEDMNADSALMLAMKQEAEQAQQASDAAAGEAEPEPDGMMMARMAPAPSAEDAVADEASQPEPAGLLGMGLNTLALVLLLSIGATMLSWTAVEKIVQRKRNVVLVSFDDVKGERMMQALTNDTCRRILSALSSGGMTESQLAEELDLSIQRIHYNLKLLSDARLIETKKFRYSKKRKEMDIYTLTNKYFIIGPPEKED